MKNYRTKTYTKRITTISSSQINRLRATQLRHAKTAKQIRFIKSKSFDKQIRQNIRQNRITANVKVLSKIERVTEGATQRKVIKSLFSEKTAIRNGRVVKTNTFTSLSQTKKLQKISKDIDRNQFNPAKYIKSTKRYKEIKKHLPAKAGISDILKSLDRTNFYYENKRTINQHNKNVEKHGVDNATTMKAGQKLQTEYYKDQNIEASEIADILIKK